MPAKPPQADEDALHASTQVVPHLQEFLSTVPTPLTNVLVGLSPYVKRIRRILEIVSWRSGWEESWLALAAWWAVCLTASMTLRYLMPIMILIAVYYYRRLPPSQPPMITEHQLRETIASLTVINDLLHPPSTSTSTSTSSPSPLPSLRPLARTLLTLYPLYLLTTFLIPLRVLLGIAGTILLTWRAHWAETLRRTLWRSAHVRWACYRAYSLLSGEPLPPLILPPASLKVYSTNEQKEKKSETTASLRFLFTLYENQRWWISLDWTSALLPAERPPWSSPPPHYLPLAPPSAFALPPDTVVYQDLESGRGKTRRRVKRTARWSWDEPEWKVVIRTEGSGASSRQERDLPAEGSSSANASSASKLLKGVVGGHKREGSTGKEKAEAEIELAEQQKRVKSELAQGQAEPHEQERDDEGDDEQVTDPDGWVYGDNKWENASAKGGMGKYTRYRRWTRIALLTETVEPVESDTSEPEDTGRKSLSLPEEHVEDVTRVNASRRDTVNFHEEKEGEGEDHGSLRQRLKAAVRRGSVVH